MSGYFVGVAFHFTRQGLSQVLKKVGDLSLPVAFRSCLCGRATGWAELFGFHALLTVVAPESKAVDIGSWYGFSEYRVPVVSTFFTGLGSWVGGPRRSLV